MSDLDIVRRLLALEKRVGRLETAGAGYEVSTWTPTYVGGTSAGVTTYTTQAGFYARLGARVDFWLLVVWTAATGTGQARISLPFTSDSTSGYRAAVSVWPENVTFTGAGVIGIINANVAYVLIGSANSNAATSIIAVEAAGTLIISGTYYI